MLPPSFIDYALRLGAQGVVIAGCRENDCEFRLGDRWVRERFTGAREPACACVATPRDRLAVVWSGHDHQRIRLSIESLRARLNPGARPHSNSSNPLQEELHD